MLNRIGMVMVWTGFAGIVAGLGRLLYHLSTINIWWAIEVSSFILMIVGIVFAEYKEKNA